MYAVLPQLLELSFKRSCRRNLGRVCVCVCVCMCTFEEINMVVMLSTFLQYYNHQAFFIITNVRGGHGIVTSLLVNFDRQTNRPTDQQTGRPGHAQGSYTSIDIKFSYSFLKSDSSSSYILHWNSVFLVLFSTHTYMKEYASDQSRILVSDLS